MKFLLMILVSGLFLSSVSMACGDEVLVQGTIGRSEFTLGVGCQVFFEKVTTYSADACSMDVQEVLASCFWAAVANGHECSLQAGDLFDGTIVKFGRRLWDKKAIRGILPNSVSVQ